MQYVRQRALQKKTSLLRCSKGSEVRKKNPVSRGDYIFDRKTLNLADVSSFSPCATNLLRIVESGSALAINLGFSFSVNKLTTCYAENLLAFHNQLRQLRVCASREAVSKLTA